MPRALVVLGAGGAVGRGVVEAAIEAGRTVVAVGLDGGGRDALVARHPRAGVHALLAPVASDADAASLAHALRAMPLAFDGVVASLAGRHSCGRLVDEPAEVLQRTLDQDLLPHLFAARHLLPLLADDADGYVLIGGPGGRYPWAGYGHCSIAAAALRMMARVLHDEAARQGQRVQLLSLDAPVDTAADAAHAGGAWPKAHAVGRRALAMLEGARHTAAAPIVEFTSGEMTSQVIAAPRSPPPSSPRTVARDAPASVATVLPARDLRAARALLDAIASPLAPGSVHDEHC